MKRRASEFRYANILPNPIIDRFAGQTVKAVRFLKNFDKLGKWYEYEREVEIDFADESDSDVREINRRCGSCGLCCKDIPNHQIGIYMSEGEFKIAVERGHNPIYQGSLIIDFVLFFVLGVKENGDCVMLGPDGCTLGNEKPLWCKIYHCEKFQGKRYIYE